MYHPHDPRTQPETQLKPVIMVNGWVRQELDTEPTRIELVKWAKDNDYLDCDSFTYILGKIITSELDRIEVDYI
jgi:hypothetical protein